VRDLRDPKASAEHDRKQGAIARCLGRGREDRDDLRLAEHLVRTHHRGVRRPERGGDDVTRRPVRAHRPAPVEERPDGSERLPLGKGCQLGGDDGCAAAGEEHTVELGDGIDPELGEQAVAVAPVNLAGRVRVDRGVQEGVDHDRPGRRVGEHPHRRDGRRTDCERRARAGVGGVLHGRHTFSVFGGKKQGSRDPEAGQRPEGWYQASFRLRFSAIYAIVAKWKI